MRRYLLNVFLGLGDFAVGIGGEVSTLASVFTGGERGQSLSTRIGRSIERGGIADRIPWPSRLREHFIRKAT